MKAEKEVLQENGAKKARLKMTYSILILTALFVAELYLMMNYPTDYLFIGVVGLAILCFVYLVTDLVFKVQNDKEGLRHKEYESIYKAEKVSYVLMKQSFMDMESTLDRVREICEIPTEELIEAQKAIGRVTIQRNKENIRTLAAGNEKIAMQIQDLDRKIQETLRAVEALKGSDSVIEALEGVKSALREELMNLEVFTESKMNAVSDTLMHGIEQSDSAMQERLDSLERPIIPEQKASEAAVLAEEPIVEGPTALAEDGLSDNLAADLNEMPSPSDELLMDETPSSADEFMAEEAPMPVEEPVTEETPVTEPVTEKAPVEEPEPKEKPAQVPAMEKMSSAEQEQLMEEMLKALEKPSIKETPETVEEPPLKEEPKAAEAPSAEPVLEAGKIMTPEEVAMLLDQMDDGKAEEPIIEEPAAPAASDPGHVMTPEEIAAMLANM